MHVLATAGHVDHGKSTLVRALTGMEPDRFAEERRRGLTIDLGYAWTTLPSDEEIAFVDVPGHQRFIANMLAGLGPAPAVLFVVAADEGWSRQSGEHLAAIDALQVRHAVLAVTRADLADPAPALADAAARLAATSLGTVDAVAVSGATGAGLAALRTALDRLVASLPLPDALAPVRLWLDRSFSIRGAGTVVTGTLAAGSVGVGDTLALREGTVTVRGVQSTGTELDRVDGVARVALNLRGTKPDAVGRGDVLLTPDAWHRTDALDVRLTATEDALPAELVLHVGTAAVPVRVRPLDPSATLARLTLAEALPLRAGDRAVLRDPGRQAVAAGVLVLDADPPSLRRRGAARARAGELVGATGTPDVTVEVGRRGVARRDHLARLGVPVGEADLAPGAVRALGDWLVADPTWRRWVANAPAVLATRARSHPLDPSPSLGAFGRALALPDDAVLVRAVVAAAGLRVGDGRVEQPGARPAPQDVHPGIRALVDRLAGAPFAAPERDELAELGLGPRQLAAAAKAGLVVRLGGDVVLAADAAARATTVLAGLEQPFTASAARQALGTTRRVAIPLLEHLDHVGVTVRVDATRRLVRS
ncbi:selenocysteine-specific translation elongation factor SelB [Jatrophihabitans endophyticus]|uniref:Selenocysteine-specific translation elongation factor SelB n=1 Tax=Jatrophihabitans endophyticus TaxID=1206085 RepID=A0A1M5E5P3_9ACTN|nr:selenocysteine-specific translation elongation factor [Jatrophihabitans endophyticus]SHF74559.1 selenocysteine-specific translation elongation factor SelB [Jatrophihabitans endophyticus]